MIDYSKPKHWLALPSTAAKAVDIFYVYPTSWQNDPKVPNDKNEPHVCTINNPSMLAGSRTAFESQATAFETVGNVYAPYYRQVDATYALSLGSREERDAFIGGIPKSDVLAAFDYYIRHYNQGRPYILVSHSQGSLVLQMLLSEYMQKNPAAYARMIAAYAIGYSITKDYLHKNPHLRFAEGPDDTGVIISYNTEAPVIAGNNPLVLPGAMAINPITWRRDGTSATAEQSLGSRLEYNGKYVDKFKYADARVDQDRGVVICNVDDKTLPESHWSKGIYHHHDVGLYYYNLRQNAANRAARFLSKGDALQETIWSLEMAYFTNLYRAEHEKVLALVHPNFFGWPDGQTSPFDREGSAAFMKKLATKPIPCRIQIERAGIRIQGNVALTQYILRAHSTGTDGTTTTRSSRVCHTWIKDGSDWKLLGGMSRDL